MNNNSQHSPKIIKPELPWPKLKWKAFRILVECGESLIDSRKLLAKDERQAKLVLTYFIKQTMLNSPQSETLTFKMERIPPSTMVITMETKLTTMGKQ